MSTYENCQQHLEELPTALRRTESSWSSRVTKYRCHESTPDWPKRTAFSRTIDTAIIIWNFPCIRAPDGSGGQVQELQMNVKLPKSFFQNDGRFLSFGASMA